MVWIMVEGSVEVLEPHLWLLLLDGHHPQVVVQVGVLLVYLQRLLNSWAFFVSVLSITVLDTLYVFVSAYLPNDLNTVRIWTQAVS